MLKNGVTLIAEVKTESPFGFKSDKSFDYLFDIADHFGDIISIHTDKRWGGSFDLLKKAREKTSKPLLAKGIHKTDDEIQTALSCGADFVLVVGRIPSVIPSKNLLIEPNSLMELKSISADFKVVWNARNLQTGKPKEESFNDARKIFKGWLCQASYIDSPEDVLLGANAIIVGENLPNFINML